MNMFIAEEKDNGKRLDQYLSGANPSFSRGHFQRLIKDGKVTVNGIPEISLHYKMKENDAVAYTFTPRPTTLKAEKIPLTVIYEDANILVVNKAAGIVVHPACGHFEGTLLNAVAGHARGKFHPQLVHRLDKDTSGVMVVAKNERAKNSLVKQFQNRTIKKVYLSAVAGIVHEETGIIEAPLGRSPEDRRKIVVGPLSKKMAVTKFRVVHRGRDFSLLEVYPVTGRTHQIRSHMAFIGYPVLGDATYGGPEKAAGMTFKRHMLHAYKLSFTHPSKARTVSFEAPPPQDIAKLWKVMKK